MQGPELLKKCVTEGEGAAWRHFTRASAPVPCMLLLVKLTARAPGMLSRDTVH